MKPCNGVPKIRGLSQTEPRGQGGASRGAYAQTCDASKNTTRATWEIDGGRTIHSAFKVCQLSSYVAQVTAWNETDH